MSDAEAADAVGSEEEDVEEDVEPEQKQEEEEGELIMLSLGRRRWKLIILCPTHNQLPLLPLPPVDRPFRCPRSRCSLL